jgi:glycerol-3-phosphate acyltransferase PlsY
VAPLVAAAGGAIWILVFVTTRYASLASILTAASIPVLALLFGYPTSVVVFGVAAAAAVTFLHRANLRRLRAGTENRFHFRRPARA